MTSSPLSSPLGQRIQRILLERKQPIPFLELLTLLRRQGQSVSDTRLRALLANPQVFLALANDYFTLRGHMVEPQDPVEPVEASVEQVYLVNLPKALHDYVILDIETSGLDPQLDQMIQLAALRVRSDRPVEFRSWYLYCDPARLSIALRTALHLTDQLVEQIALAPTIDILWPEICAFLANDPLVIHNARFDTQFLLHHDPSLSNSVVDSMELALLVAPEANRHNLSAISEHLGIALDTVTTSDIIGVPVDHQFSTDTLHNAITDVLLLDAVYRALLQQWHALPADIRAVYTALLPETLGHTEVESARLPAPANRSTTSHPQSSLRVASASEALERVAAHATLSPRPSQRTMIALIDEALTTDHSLLIEAPTGTGKTLGYLIPAVTAAQRAGRRIALATAFKNLQDQLRQEVARVQEVLPFRAQVLKGASSYLCLRNLQQAVDDAVEADIERRYILTFLASWSALTDLATLDELPYWLRSTFPATAAIEHEVAVDRATCTEQRCPFFERCHLFTAYRRGDQADILLINQALWLAEPSAMPTFDALVIDEAHNLEDMATSALREEVSEASLRSLLYQLSVPGTRRGVLQRILDAQSDSDIRAHVHSVRNTSRQILRLLVELRTTLANFVIGCDEQLDPKQGAQLRLGGSPSRIYPTRWPLVQQALDQIWRVYMPELQSGLGQLQQIHFDEIIDRTVEAVRTRLGEQTLLLSMILQAGRSDIVAWIEVHTDDQTANWGFYTAPISVAQILAERYESLRSVILTSATLTTGPHDFGFFVERLGLRGLVTAEHIHTLEGVLPYHTNVLLGLPTYLNYTPSQVTMQSFVQEFADELALLFTYTNGHALTLFTARSRMEAVWERNHAELEVQGVPVLVQHKRESKRRLIEQFREHGAGVLYGLKSFWEGIDVPGRALSLVVMEKLPYPAFKDPIHAARREAISQQSGREFQDYLFPLMVLQFKQGFGRLLRHHDDRGAVILYDKRVARKSYLPNLLGALPGFQPRDPAAERSRRQFYQLIAERVPGLIDVEAKAEFLATLPDILQTDLEALVEQLALPEILLDHEYDLWRPRILQAIKELYGHDGFRSAQQEAALRAMLTGRDVVAVLPTGAGKSLCFQLPALLRSGTTIICSPLIALMRDQIDKLYERNIEIAAALMSGQHAADREETLARLRAGRLRILYLAPERLRDPVVRAALAAAPIRQIVVDEAHCVALWGPSFRPDFLVLPQIYELLPQRPPVAAFTATATPEITTAIQDGLRLEEPIIVRSSIDRPELWLVVFDRNHRYHPIRSKSDQIRRLTLLVQVADARGEAMLIYVATTKEAEYLARLLQVAGYAARAYHGKMPIQERTTVGELFMEGLINIVVCTKAFGMGIDKPDIRYVVHFNMPGDLESYAQEVGRAGRDGQLAYGILLYHPSDENIQRFFIEQSRPDSQLLGNLWHWMRQQPLEWTLDPQAACERFDIDELALRRAIYLLENTGVIRRGPDLTIRGSLTLLTDWDHALELLPEPQRDALAQVRIALPMLTWTPQEINLQDLALAAECTVTQLEHVLIELAVAGGCLYRPWEKGYHITRLVVSEMPLPTLYGDVTLAQEYKLTQMRQYIQSRDCRWQILRCYFGEAPGQPCGQCDRCNPEQIYPWSDKTGRDVPDVTAFLDLATTLLELVDWNERRRPGAQPYSIKSLLRILRGDEYALMHNVPPGQAADARRRALRACPYWGVCRTLRRSVDELSTLLQRLEHEDYIRRQTVQFGPDSSYEHLALTERGRTQLLSGERLGWE